MPSPPVPADSVTLAQQLLELVKSIAPTDPHDGEEKGPVVDPHLAWNANIQIQNICDRLLAKTMGPLEYTVLLAESCQESQALYFVTALDIADLIGDDEASLKSLSEKAGVESQFLGVAMSCVLGRGYFEEVGRFGSRIYKNNELSLVLREHHPSSLRKAVGFAGDEAFRATSYLLDAAKITLPSDQGTQPKRRPAFNLAFGFSGSSFEWRARPENAWRAERMGSSMHQFDRMANSHLSEDYPWHDLASPIVDVGGGMGSLEMTLFKCARYSHLAFIIFDLPATIEAAKKIWSTHPAAAAARVAFVGGSFMARTLSESHIPAGKPTYVIRHVLHNWTDENVLHILGMVRRAMPRHARLLLVEVLLRPESSRFVRATSMQLLALGSGVTRTQDEIERLVAEAGFRVVAVTHMRASDSVIEVASETDADGDDDACS